MEETLSRLLSANSLVMYLLSACLSFVLMKHIIMFIARLTGGQFFFHFHFQPKATHSYQYERAVSRAESRFILAKICRGLY
ncbi:hypothetical protein BDV26DRAFT_251208 [Aspergillus bertholletiae]|uniref:Uncharacterized protein n=1 Tax=Aspergillus bertholletiae TaxID=1226010 RepID=A0A5N7BNZ4_9EURO|nr:hypothetical protein BDV26DRAFT_251208 [Aspergillus bertholletiae]